MLRLAATARKAQQLLPHRLHSTAFVTRLRPRRSFTATMKSADADKQNAAAAASPVETKPAEEKLPPLSDHDFRIFNHTAEQMNYFHENFRRTWNLLWTYATTGKRQNGMTLKQLIRAGIDFGRHLTAHHGIEEKVIFPHLGKRMPEFDAKRGDLLGQHRQIHKGLDELEAYLAKVQRGEEELEASTLKAKMESWGGVLWAHLDDEVKALGAENMRKYWTKEEVMNMRW